MNSPLVSIIIPCRNEADFISRCLDSLLNQNYPKNKIEILVIDGASTDGTRKIIESYAEIDNRIKLFSNPQKFTPISLNIGIQNAKGDLITKSDAHTVYPPDYISKCVYYLTEYPKLSRLNLDNLDAVGGITKNVPAVDSLAARAIVSVLGFPLGGGGAFRQGGGKPRLADTAFGICYRKEVFQKIGLFNENLIRSQDFDFNLRLTQARGKLLLAPDIILTYYPKQKTIISFWRRNFLDGIWAILPLKFGSPIFKPRHLAPLVFVSVILLGFIGAIFWLPFLWPFIWLANFILIIYPAIILFFSMKIAIQEREIQLFPFLILAFAARHLAYGLGSIVGIVKLLIPSK